MRFSFVRIYILIVLLAGLSSCEKFLEVDVPDTQLTTPAVYSDVATATAAVADIYARMRETGFTAGNQGLTFLTGLYSDEFNYYSIQNASYRDFYNHNLTPADVTITSWWSTAYSEIYAANLLMEGVASSPALSAPDKARLRGEGLFIRAFLHFYLVNLYGDIPYVTATDFQENARVERLKEQAVYDHIIADLKESKELLPSIYATAQRVRPNKAAAVALLARVYLYTHAWDAAKTEASALIGQPSVYRLQDNLDQVYLKESTETIWQLHSGSPGVNTGNASYVFTSGPPPTSALTPALTNTFEPNDQRAIRWVGSVTEGNNTWFYPYKYKQPLVASASFEYEVVFRLAEQYLIRAEAFLHLGDLVNARADLDSIRHRAGLGNTPAVTEDQIMEAILKERQKELFVEWGHRWFDLKRTGKASAIVGALKPNWKDTQVRFPIPETELLSNTQLKPQNAGY